MGATLEEGMGVRTANSVAEAALRTGPQQHDVAGLAVGGASLRPGRRCVSPSETAAWRWSWAVGRLRSPVRRGRRCEGYSWTGNVLLRRCGRASPRSAATAFATAATVVVAPIPVPWRCRNASAKRDGSTGGTGRNWPVGQLDGRGAGAAGAPGGCRVASVRRDRPPRQ